MSDARIEAVFTGGPKTLHDAAGAWRTSIRRTRVEGPVTAEVRGLVGDKATKRFHGGPESALCVHLADHYLFWKRTEGLELGPGALGENLVLGGMREDDVSVGDVVRIGTVLAQVSGPRVPCATQARQVGRTDWVARTIAANRTGFYMRVLEPGRLGAGDAWVLEERVNEDASVPRMNRCMYLEWDPEYAARMLTMPGLSDWWRAKAAAKIKAPGRKVAG